MVRGAASPVCLVIDNSGHRLAAREGDPTECEAGAVHAVGRRDQRGGVDDGTRRTLRPRPLRSRLRADARRTGTSNTERDLGRLLRHFAGTSARSAAAPASYVGCAPSAASPPRSWVPSSGTWSFNSTTSRAFRKYASHHLLLAAVGAGRGGRSSLAACGVSRNFWVPFVKVGLQPGVFSGAYSA